MKMAGTLHQVRLMQAATDNQLVLVCFCSFSQCSWGFPGTDISPLGCSCQPLPSSSGCIPGGRIEEAKGRQRRGVAAAFGRPTRAFWKAESWTERLTLIGNTRKVEMWWQSTKKFTWHLPFTIKHYLAFYLTEKWGETANMRSFLYTANSSDIFPATVVVDT